MGKVLKSNSTGKNQSAEIDDARENNESTWQTRIHRVAVEFASTFVGQATMMQFDKLLWTLEKTATWISNSKTDAKRTKPPASLVRPLPWVFFLPTLVVLRFVRVILSLVSICFGFDVFEVSSMVSFLHKSRRSIRQILVEVKRTKADTNYQSSSIDQIKQMALSLLSTLSNLISQTSDTVKAHQNKTSLNASVNDMTMKEHGKNDGIATRSDESESEEEIYQNFLTQTIESSDTDDDDFVFDELNGEDTSDTDSQSSIASDDLSDDEANAMGSAESTMDSAKGNDSNHSDNTTNSVDHTEKAQNDSTNDAEPSTGNETDDKLNRLIENTSTTREAKGHPTNRGKNINRSQKNGRNNAKAHNNGKHINGAHAHAKSKTTKQHTDSTTDFITEAVATEADRT